MVTKISINQAEIVRNLLARGIPASRSNVAKAIMEERARQQRDQARQLAEERAYEARMKAKYGKNWRYYESGQIPGNVVKFPKKYFLNVNTGRTFTSRQAAERLGGRVVLTSAAARDEDVRAKAYLKELGKPVKAGEVLSITRPRGGGGTITVNRNGVVTERDGSGRVVSKYNVNLGDARRIIAAEGSLIRSEIEGLKAQRVLDKIEKGKRLALVSKDISSVYRKKDVKVKGRVEKFKEEIGELSDAFSKRSVKLREDVFDTKRGVIIIGATKNPNLAVGAEVGYRIVKELGSWISSLGLGTRDTALAKKPLEDAGKDIIPLVNNIGEMYRLSKKKSRTKSEDKRLSSLMGSFDKGGVNNNRIDRVDKNVKAAEKYLSTRDAKRLRSIVYAFVGGMGTGLVLRGISALAVKSVIASFIARVGLAVGGGAIAGNLIVQYAREAKDKGFISTGVKAIIELGAFEGGSRVVGGIRLPESKAELRKRALKSIEEAKLPEYKKKLLRQKFEAGWKILKTQKASPRVKNLNLRGVDRLDSKSARILGDWLVRESKVGKIKPVVGGSVAQKTQIYRRAYDLDLVRSKKPSDVDIFVKNPKKAGTSLYRDLKRQGVDVRLQLSRKKGMMDSAKLIINNRKAIEFHTLEWAVSFGYSKTAIKTPQGIRVLRLKEQQARKLVGAIIGRRSKDIAGFEEITLSRINLDRVMGNASQALEARRLLQIFRSDRILEVTGKRPRFLSFDRVKRLFASKKGSVALTSGKVEGEVKLKLKGEGRVRLKGKVKAKKVERSFYVPVKRVPKSYVPMRYRSRSYVPVRYVPIAVVRKAGVYEKVGENKYKRVPPNVYRPVLKRLRRVVKPIDKEYNPLKGTDYRPFVGGYPSVLLKKFNYFPVKKVKSIVSKKKVKLSDDVKEGKKKKLQEISKITQNFKYLPDLYSRFYGVRASAKERKSLLRSGRIFTGLEARKLVKGRRRGR